MLRVQDRARKLLCRISASVHGQRVAQCSGTCENEPPYKRLIGNREIVGFGYNGQPAYLDIDDFPCPAIRYKECTPELMALREKERGDWRKLTVDEKKYLYRASFRQTYEEMQAPSTYWKSIVGTVLLGISAGLWIHLFEHHYVHKDAPSSFSAESRIQQYYRQIAINNQPMQVIRPPPGAEPRVHPKNKEMLKQIQEAEAKRAAAKQAGDEED